MATPVRPNVARMHPYQPGKPISAVKRELGLTEVVKLASNENPFGPSPKAVAAMKKAMEELHLYPDGASFDLRDAISRKFGVPFAQTVVGNGSEELIANLGLSLIDSPEDEIITSQHSFPRYQAAADLMGCRFIAVPMGAGWRYDMDAISKAVTERTKIVFIANPNNPTGTLIPKAEIEALLRDLPSHTLLALDEAYFEFAQHSPDCSDGRTYVLDGKNVVAMRTFSKIYGLAGIRIGYAFVPEYVTEAFDRVRAPFDMNSLAQAAGIAALEDDEFLTRTLDNNQRGLELLGSAAKEMGCEVTESFTNFHFIDLKRPCLPVFEALLAKGFITRPCSGYGAPNHIRVSIGTEAENEGFIRAFREVMGG